MLTSLSLPFPIEQVVWLFIIVINLINMFCFTSTLIFPSYILWCYIFQLLVPSVFINTLYIILWIIIYHYFFRFLVYTTGDKHKACGPNPALHLVLSGPAPCFYPVAVPSSLPLVKEQLHLHSPIITFDPLKAIARLMWPPVRMSLTPLHKHSDIYYFMKFVLLWPVITIIT